MPNPFFDSNYLSKEIIIEIICLLVLHKEDLINKFKLLYLKLKYYSLKIRKK